MKQITQDRIINLHSFLSHLSIPSSWSFSLAGAYTFLSWLKNHHTFPSGEMIQLLEGKACLLKITGWFMDLIQNDLNFNLSDQCLKKTQNPHVLLSWGPALQSGPIRRNPSHDNSPLFSKFRFVITPGVEDYTWSMSPESRLISVLASTNLTLSVSFFTYVQFLTLPSTKKNLWRRIYIYWVIPQLDQANRLINFHQRAVESYTACVASLTCALSPKRV
jgi:hypothetical protein